MTRNHFQSFARVTVSRNIVRPDNTHGLSQFRSKKVQLPVLLRHLHISPKQRFDFLQFRFPCFSDFFNAVTKLPAFELAVLYEMFSSRRKMPHADRRSNIRVGFQIKGFVKVNVIDQLLYSYASSQNIALPQLQNS